MRELNFSLDILPSWKFHITTRAGVDKGKATTGFIRSHVTPKQHQFHQIYRGEINKQFGIREINIF